LKRYFTAVIEVAISTLIWQLYFVERYGLYGTICAFVNI